MQLDLTIEKGTSDREWYLSWTNKIDQSITDFDYILEARNQFGQILGQCDGLIIDKINPGQTLKTGKITNLNFGLFGPLFELYDVQLELDITNAKNGLEELCD